MAILNTTDWGTAPEPDTTKKKPPEKTGFIDGLKATWQQESIWHGSDVRSRIEYPNDPSFDYQTYDQKYWPVVAEARNRDHADALAAQFDKEQRNKEIIDNQSFALGLATNVLVGATNPLNYIGVGKAATFGAAAVKGAVGAVVGTALTEPILHANQVSRTLEDSLWNTASAAVLGAPLGVAGKAIGNKLEGRRFLENEPVKPEPGVKTPINQGIEGAFGGDSISAARVRSTAMEDSRISLIPFLPKSWNESIVRFSLFGPLNRSANQRLSTSSFEASRKAQQVLLRSSLATDANVRGDANVVPIEVAAGQRVGDLATQLQETDKALRDAWWKKVEGGTYDRDEIIANLKVLDPSIDDTYVLNRSSFDRVVKAYMADATGFGSQMDEVVKRVDLAAKQREALDADKIDFGLADKSQLEEIATGRRLVKPEETIEYRTMALLREQKKELSDQISELRAAKADKADIDAANARLAQLEQSLEQNKRAFDAYKADYDSITPSSKTHRFSYQDGSHYLSRAFDKGRITGNREGFKQALLDGWRARNPNVDWEDPYVAHQAHVNAELVTNKILNEDDVVSIADLNENLDLPGNYTKDRSLNIDDKYLLNWTSDDVLSTEMYHLSQAVVDVELARQGVKFNDLIADLNREYAKRSKEINEKYKGDAKKVAREIAALGKEKDLDIEQLEFAMRRLKRKGPKGLDSMQKLFNTSVGIGNRVAGMAQLGSSALPNSLGDVASVARALGTGRTLKLVAKMFTPEARKDMTANAKQLGLLSQLIDTTIREQQLSEQLSASMNPNRGFAGRTAQAIDRGTEKAQDIFSKVSLIDYWARSTRVVASAASTQHIIDAAAKGWDNLSSTTRTDLAKFYIDSEMLGRIADQVKKHATDVDGVKFAEIDKWDDIEAARVFKASVYAHTEAALNIPSIGTGSKFMSENFFGRMLTRFQSFNNASYESTFLQSLQNREASRIATGIANYAFWGFAALYAYDTVTGRDTSMEKYFGSADKATLTAWKILAKGGYVAAPTDKTASILKFADADWNPFADELKAVVPDGLSDELFPKYDDVDFLEKLVGPTYAYGKKSFEALGGALDGELTQKDVGKIRDLMPGQNIGWLRRGIDYVEEALGGRDADRNANK